jgi:hypothetical protein
MVAIFTNGKPFFMLPIMPQIAHFPFIMFNNIFHDYLPAEGLRLSA